MNPQPYDQMAPLDLLELCDYREARGEGMIGKRGVAWVVMNRANHPGWWGHDIVNVILKKWQFSSFNEGDANETVWPTDETEQAFIDCREACAGAYYGTYTDPTVGATYYHDISIPEPPLWIRAGYVLTLAVGRLKFYREV